VTLTDQNGRREGSQGQMYVHPKPHTLNPKPLTPNHKPSTLNPKP